VGQDVQGCRRQGTPPLAGVLRGYQRNGLSVRRGITGRVNDVCGGEGPCLSLQQQPPRHPLSVGQGAAAIDW